MTYRGEKEVESITGCGKIDKAVPDFVLLMAHNFRGGRISQHIPFCLPGDGPERALWEKVPITH
jgi:hypothetical protein